MKLNSKPFSIYAHDVRSDKQGLWFRVKSFRTMGSAFQSLKELTRKPREERNYIYLILPNQGEQKKYIMFKDEHINNAIKSAR